MGRQKGFHWTEEQKKKIGDAQRAYRDKVGRIIDIDQRESPEAYRNYQREYQRKWREKHPDYYNRYHRKPIPNDMQKFQEIQKVYDEIVTSAIANEYNKFEKQTDIMPLVDKLHEMLIKYASEVKEEAKEDANK